MKKILYALIITLLFSNIEAYSDTVVSNLMTFDISPKNGGQIVVSSSSPTSVAVELALSRGFGGLTYNAYDPVTFVYSIVYVQNGTESILKSESTITESSFQSGYGILQQNFNLTIPAGFVGGQVKLKYKNYRWYQFATNLNGWNPSQGYNYTDGIYTKLLPQPPAPTSSPIAIHVYHSSSGKDHYLTTYKELEGQSWWTYIGVHFYAYNTQVSGTVPVYEFTRDDIHDHCYSTNPNYAIPYGFTRTGIKFYAYPSQVAGSIPVYEFYNSADTDHAYATGSNYASGPAWVINGMPFYVPSNP